jgi:TPR repeat protein
VLAKFLSGPPGGTHLPSPAKSRIPDKNGGIYGHAASGAGNPLLFNMNSHQSALRPQDVLVHYEYLANKGEVSAQHIFGQLLYTGTENLPVNYARAFTYFYKAAQQYPTGIVCF